MAIDRTKFIAVLGRAFPVLTVTTAAKCWDDVKRMPEPALGALYEGLLHASIAALDARAAEQHAITSAIGLPDRAR